MTISEPRLLGARRRRTITRPSVTDGGVPLNRRDYMALPEDGTDSEIIFGALDVIPKALYGHQRVVFDLASAIQAHVAADGGEVAADIDLMLNDMHTYVSPDLMYFTRPQMARINPNRRVTRPPTLVVSFDRPRSIQ